MDEMSFSLNRKLGKRIQAAREAAGMTQGELGKAVGFSQGSVASWETGRRSVSLETIKKIASALSISPMALTSDPWDETLPGLEAIQPKDVDIQIVWCKLNRMDDKLDEILRRLPPTHHDTP